MNNLRTFYSHFTHASIEWSDAENHKEERLGFQRISAMSLEEVGAEQLAEVFHHYHQALTENLRGVIAAPAESWSELPESEKDRMIDAARLTLLELDSGTARRKYFAKPGEAEWGC